MRSFITPNNVDTCIKCLHFKSENLHCKFNKLSIIIFNDNISAYLKLSIKHYKYTILLYCILYCIIQIQILSIKRIKDIYEKLFSLEENLCNLFIFWVENSKQNWKLNPVITKCVTIFLPSKTLNSVAGISVCAIVISFPI